jgi:DNA topoisomerase-1
MSGSEEEEFAMEEEEGEVPETPIVKKKKKKRKIKYEDDFIDDDGLEDDDGDEDFIASPSPVASSKPKKIKMEESDSKPKAKKIKIKPDLAVSSDHSVKKKKRKKDKESAAAAAASRSATKKSKGGTTTSTTTTTTERQLKKLDKTERLQYAMQAFLWWEGPVLAQGMNWSTLEHSGVSFPDEYVPHGVKMLYDGQPVELTPAQEEAATFFAGMDPEGMHLGNPKTAPIFIKNFFADFRQILGKKHIIKDFKKCDFEPIRKYLNEQKIIKKAISDKERQANK